MLKFRYQSLTLKYIEIGLLTITWASNVRGVRCKSKLRDSVNLLAGIGRQVASLCRLRLAYAPKSNTASHDNLKKINLSVPLHLVAIRAAGAPLP